MRTNFPLTRRRLVQGSFATAILTALPLSARGTPLPSRGCCVTNSEFSSLLNSSSGIQSYQQGSEPIVHHSNNPHFDQALAMMLASISKVFDVLPGFGYYDDGNSHNAYANPVNRTNRSDGTVLFGLGLLSDKLEATPGGVQVAAVCAHEFGHVVQFKHKIQSRLGGGYPTVKPIELHADFLAGYFAACYQEKNPHFHAEEFAMSQYNGGDTATWDSRHHGTDKERGAAVAAGFGCRKRSSLNLDDAIEFGIKYAMST
jgi:hypothetical protein